MSFNGQTDWRRVRELLHNEMEKEFLPTLLARGFKHVEGKKPTLHSQYLRRRTSGIDVIWINWEKYGRPKFILDFWTRSWDGTETSAEQLRRLAVQQAFHFRVRPTKRTSFGPGGWCWFGLGLYWTKEGERRAVHKVVADATKALDSMDNLMIRGETSRNIVK